MAPARSDIRATLLTVNRRCADAVPEMSSATRDAVERHRFPSNGLKALDGGRNARPNGVMPRSKSKPWQPGETGNLNEAQMTLVVMAIALALNVAWAVWRRR